MIDLLQYSKIHAHLVLVLAEAFGHFNGLLIKLVCEIMLHYNQGIYEHQDVFHVQQVKKHDPSSDSFLLNLLVEIKEPQLRILADKDNLKCGHSSPFMMAID